MATAAGRHVLLIAARAHLDELTELVEAWRGVGARVSVDACDGALPDVAALVRAGEALDAVLLVGPPRRAPSTVLAGPCAADRRGRRVPLAWLPATSASALRRFAASAARVHRRPADGRAALALLAQWQPGYLQVVDRMQALLRPHARAFVWTGDRVTREGLVAALGSGLGLGVYVGHGRPSGWVGYHGLRGHHFPDDAEPLGALLSLCCRTASRRRTGLSYAEALPLQGVASACLGAVGDTLHSDNTRWAIGLCDAVAAGLGTVGELVARAAPAADSARAPYRLIGDPLAPLASSAAALRRAARVPVYP